MSNLSNSSGSLKSQPSSKGHPLGLSTSTSNLLLEKVNGRRSTPDSDAMASSEDDENHHLETAMPAAAAHKPVRRASWLNDPSQPMPLGQPRKNSFASSTMSPTASHPTTPSTETSLWGTHGPAAPGIAAGRGASAAFSWGQGIWNTNSKEPPPRLTEVFASSPPASNSSFANAELFGSETTPTAESSLPFQIPLHPTPKTYRSQSYSVGQMEADLANTNSAIAPGFGRGRGPNQPGLQHRPSRPSMLSEISDSTGLGKLKEVEDDEADSLESSTQSLLQMRDPSKVVEDLLRENAMLKQQQQQQNLRSLRPRSATSNTLGHGVAGPFGLEGGLTEDPLDYAIDENEEIGDLHDISNRGLPGRRMSEYEFRSGSGRGAFAGLENRKLENLKKAHWQSSLGFGANEFTTPSRRHSFADVPTRHGSIGSIGDPSAGLSDLPTAQEVQRFSQADSSEYLINDHGKLKGMLRDGSSNMS